MKTLIGSLGMLCLLLNQSVSFGAPGPVLFESGELWVKDLFRGKQPLSRTNNKINQFWLSPSGLYVAYSFVHRQTPSRGPGGGGELMPFYGVGIIDIAKKKLLLEFVPNGQQSVEGKWVQESFVFAVSQTNLNYEFVPKTRRLTLSSVADPQSTQPVRLHLNKRVVFKQGVQVEFKSFSIEEAVSPDGLSDGQSVNLSILLTKDSVTIPWPLTLSANYGNELKKGVVHMEFEGFVIRLVTANLGSSSEPWVDIIIDLKSQGEAL